MRRRLGLGRRLVAVGLGWPSSPRASPSPPLALAGLGLLLARLVGHGREHPLGVVQQRDAGREHELADPAANRRCRVPRCRPRGAGAPRAGSASTLTSLSDLRSRPALLDPGRLADKRNETAVWIVWSRRTSCRSMWMIWPRILSRWKSFRITECERPPSIATSSTACDPAGVVSAVRSSRSPTLIATGSERP